VLPPVPRRPKPAAPYKIELIGAPHAPLGDLYLAVLRAPWSVVIASACALFLTLNLGFALAYRYCGGVEGVRPDSLRDAFFFSVQTMGTIGYGAMFPRSALAHALVTGEVLVSVAGIAIMTGLLFSKLSVPRARMKFAKHIVISSFNGVPTVMFRLGNERASQIIEAMVRIVIVRTEKTQEGVTFYRMYDLDLERHRSPALARSWTVMHPLVPGSPLLDATPESLAKDEIEFIITVTGIDETSAQTLHARHRYFDTDVLWGARHADLITEVENGIVVDLRKFDETVRTAPTPTFPYPRPDRATGA
jgi:inward rectifier potassium channel